MHPFSSFLNPQVVAIFSSYLWVPLSSFSSLSSSAPVQLIPYIKSPPLKYLVGFSYLPDWNLTSAAPEGLQDEALSMALWARDDLAPAPAFLSFWMQSSLHAEL